MKTPIAILLVLISLASVQGRGVPTPTMAMSWNQKADSREWVAQTQGANSQRILMEFVPKGDDINSWKELMIHQIDFTPVALRAYIDNWKAMLLRADPQIKITEEKMPDGSFLMTFLSVTPDAASGELCVRRFIKASDGIYQIAYSVRPNLKKTAIWQIWNEIVSKAALMPNPQRRR